MSEKLQNGSEKFNDSVDANAESHKNLERLREAARDAEKDPLNKRVESLQKSVEQQAVSGKETNVGDTGNEQSAQSFGVSKGLKSSAYKKTLEHTRAQMGYTGRTFSKFIHQPVIESTSNVLAKTVARPSAVLGGGIGTLLGSTALLYFAKHNGFTYNYTIFFVLFIAGFLAGGLVELLIRLLFKKKR